MSYEENKKAGAKAFQSELGSINRLKDETTRNFLKESIGESRDAFIWGYIRGIESAFKGAELVVTPKEELDANQDC